jgi:hypothetical protein
VVQRSLLMTTQLFVLVGSGSAAGFRVCDIENSHAFSASTHYVVGEVVFDKNTGEASGTETTYNYANRAAEGFTTCHVTYELTGTFEPGSGTLVLSADRSNHSASCPQEILSIHYPVNQLYALQIALQDNGSTDVYRADNGELFASGEWGPGNASYRTAEACSFF